MVIFNMIFVWRINLILLGEVRMSTGYAVSFGFMFAVIPALIVHAALYHGNVFDLFSF